MSELKTKITNANVTDFLNKVEDAQKRADNFRLLELFTKATGEKPKMWGPSIVGFGAYHYKSERSKQEGDWPLTGFSPRKENLTLYVMPGFGDFTDHLQKLGKHKTSVGCLYIKKLADVDEAVLEEIILKTYQTMKKTYGSIPLDARSLSS